VKLINVDSIRSVWIKPELKQLSISSTQGTKPGTAPDANGLTGDFS
jgi:hypothetical protein